MLANIVLVRRARSALANSVIGLSIVTLRGGVVQSSLVDLRWSPFDGKSAKDYCLDVCS